jgi:hypothetical protein
MPHFEFISVALSLFYALVIAKLLGGLPATLRQGSRYWVHALWVVNLVLAGLASWWGIWGLRDVAWNPGRFFGVFVFPGVIYLRATVLLSEEPRSVDSWRERYYRNQRSFFLLGALGSLNTAASPPLLMGVPQPLVVELGAASFAAISLLAAFVASPRLHALVAMLFFVSILAYPFLN